MPLLEERTAKLSPRDTPRHSTFDVYNSFRQAMPYIQIELSDSAQHPNKPYVIDLKDCGTLGYDQTKEVRMIRRADSMGQNAVRLCQTFVAQPILHESPNEFGLHVADTSSALGLRIWENKLGLAWTDPLFYPDQRFRLECEAPAEANKARLFAETCLIVVAGDKCLQIEDRYEADINSYSTASQYTVGIGDCPRGKKQLFNLVNNSRCFTPDNHLIGVQAKIVAQSKLPDPPQGC